MIHVSLAVLLFFFFKMYDFGEVGFDNTVIKEEELLELLTKTKSKESALSWITVYCEKFIP